MLDWKRFAYQLRLICMDSCDNGLILSAGFVSEHNLPGQLHRAGGQPDRYRERHHGDEHVRLGEHDHRSDRRRRPVAAQRALRARPRCHGKQPPAPLLLRASSSPHLHTFLEASSATSPSVASPPTHGCPQVLFISSRAVPPLHSGGKLSPEVEAQTD